MTLDRIFSSHMVLPAGRPLVFFGKGAGCGRIKIAGNEAAFSSDGEEWRAELPSMEYGGPYTVSVELDGEAIELSDVYIGEVYLFAGQSNMQFRLDQTNTPKERRRADGRLRIFCTDRTELSDFKTPDDGWTVCDADNVELWSAIAYLVSSEISARKNVAVGAIACYEGATAIESWVPVGTYERMGISIPKTERHPDHLSPAFEYRNRDGMMYNTSLAEAIPYPLTAVVWYQGESDTYGEEAKLYAKELTELIRIWREDFLSPELPFVVVQIADCEIRLCDAWREVQSAQLEVAKTVPFVKTVVSRDICETDDIHPMTKDKLSERITAALLEF
ncbi:MAG: hypothetical protein IKB38_05155 [Clostridia bacterium]|nr:hypothetical protein [Clostridia bacterium]